MIRYEPHQRFNQHYDSTVPGVSARQYTVFAYLNDVESGGETHFPLLDLKVKPVKGAALVWENHPSQSSPHHQESLHAGLPPTSGVKVGQTKTRKARSRELTAAQASADFTLLFALCSTV